MSKGPGAVPRTDAGLTGAVLEIRRTLFGSTELMLLLLPNEELILELWSLLQVVFREMLGMLIYDFAICQLCFPPCFMLNLTYPKFWPSCLAPLICFVITCS